MLLMPVRDRALMLTLMGILAAQCLGCKPPDMVQIRYDDPSKPSVRVVAAWFRPRTESRWTETYGFNVPGQRAGDHVIVYARADDRDGVKSLELKNTAIHWKCSHPGPTNFDLDVVEEGDLRAEDITFISRRSDEVVGDMTPTYRLVWLGVTADDLLYQMRGRPGLCNNPRSTIIVSYYFSATAENFGGGSKTVPIETDSPLKVSFFAPGTP